MYFSPKPICSLTKISKLVKASALNWSVEWVKILNFHQFAVFFLTTLLFSWIKPTVPLLLGCFLWLLLTCQLPSSTLWSPAASSLFNHYQHPFIALIFFPGLLLQHNQPRRLPQRRKANSPRGGKLITTFHDIDVLVLMIGEVGRSQAY